MPLHRPGTSHHHRHRKCPSTAISGSATELTAAHTHAQISTDLEGIEVMGRDLSSILPHRLWPPSIGQHRSSWDSNERYAAETMASHLTSNEDTDPPAASPLIPPMPSTALPMSSVRCMRHTSELRALHALHCAAVARGMCLLLVSLAG